MEPLSTTLISISLWGFFFSLFHTSANLLHVEIINCSEQRLSLLYAHAACNTEALISIRVNLYMIQLTIHV